MGAGVREAQEVCGCADSEPAPHVTRKGVAGRASAPTAKSAGGNTETGTRPPAASERPRALACACTVESSGLTSLGIGATTAASGVNSTAPAPARLRPTSLSSLRAAASAGCARLESLALRAGRGDCRAAGRRPPGGCRASGAGRAGLPRSVTRTPRRRRRPSGRSRRSAGSAPRRRRRRDSRSTGAAPPASWFRAGRPA